MIYAFPGKRRRVRWGQNNIILHSNVFYDVKLLSCPPFITPRLPEFLGEKTHQLNVSSIIMPRFIRNWMHIFFLTKCFLNISVAPARMKSSNRNQQHRKLDPENCVYANLIHMVFEDMLCSKQIAQNWKNCQYYVRLSIFDMNACNSILITRCLSSSFSCSKSEIGILNAHH